MSEILNELQEVKKASQEQTAASQAQTAEVAGKMGMIDQKVDSKISEMDSKIKQATSDIVAAIDSQINMVLYVDVDNGSPDNDGITSATPLNSVSAALKKTLVGTYAQIYLRGAGQVHVIDEDFMLINQVILFSSWNNAGIRPRLTHSVRKDADKIIANSLSLSRNSMFVSNGVDVLTSRWQDWISDGEFDSYNVPLFKTHSTYACGGKVLIQQATVEINNSPLISQHSAGGIGWLDLVGLTYVTVDKRDLSSEQVTTGHQYLLDQYGPYNLLWDFSFVASSISSGETIPDLVSPTVIKDKINSNVPLTA